THDFVNDWLARMNAGWTKADFSIIKDLFSETERYYETPFEKPATNISEILKLWKGVEKQIIKKLEFKVLAIEKNTAIVQWYFERKGATFDGIYELKFNDNKKCIFFMAWEMEK
ncbi:MAG: hypothetical protein FWC51_01805, partial [Proteobacteria bacterium]|nr:hypothetical protein [Pseudomonadota bacterium]